eukprot:8119128-Pyramimonas_sp.AAC.1
MPWVKEVMRSPTAWKRTLREALNASVDRLKRDVKARAWEIRVLNELTAAGLPSRRDLPVARPPEDQLSCHFCAPRFDSVRSLDAHTRTNHFLTRI